MRISALVNVAHRYEGEVAKIAGDCLICMFSILPEENDDGGQGAFERGKKCSAEMLKIIKQVNPDLDLHGGLAATMAVQRIHLKELRGSSPRSNSARQRMKKEEVATMSRSELERSKQRWFLIAGRPIKTAGSLLDKAKPGTIETFGVNIITQQYFFRLFSRRRRIDKYKYPMIFPSYLAHFIKSRIKKVVVQHTTTAHTAH